MQTLSLAGQLADGLAQIGRELRAANHPAAGPIHAYAVQARRLEGAHYVVAQILRSGTINRHGRQFWEDTQRLLAQEEARALSDNARAE